MIFEKLDNIILKTSQFEDKEIKDSINKLIHKPIKLELLENFIKVKEKLQLNDFEVNILYILFAPEISSKYNKIYALLQNDLNKPYPTIELVIKILSNSSSNSKDLYHYFNNNSKLYILSLIEFIPDNQYEPLYQQAVKLSSTLRNYLIGETYLSRSLKSYCTILEPISENENKDYIESSFKPTLDKQYIINIYGNSKEQNKQKAIYIASNLKFGILFIDLKEAFEDINDINKLLSILVRDALLSGTILYFENVDSFLEKEILLLEDNLIKKLEELTWISFFSTKKKWFPINLPNNFEVKHIKEKVTQVSKSMTDSPLSLYATHIKNNNTFDDIILPTKQKNQLEEIISHYRYSEQVFNKWEFKKFFQSTGINLLFSGASGTGKTMAASILAKELNLELFKIDLSNMVSKYIGETEKNLSTLFNLAQESNIILFFDEADAIFGKRTNIKEAHDRHANIETSYLLQKIEEYEGIVILASNFRENIDEAFIRRLRFIIEFPTPNFKQREAIWNKVLNKEYLKEYINFSFLAKQFKLSGANIRNVALYSAFYASEDNSKIDKIHIIRAIKTELDKTNIIVEDSEFKEFLKD